MKSLLLFFILIFSSMFCAAQSLFFDNLINSTWTSDSYITEPVMSSLPEIALRKLNFARDSLRSNVTIWSFKNKSVTIHHYNSMQKNLNPIGSYKYQVDRKNGLLKIIMNDNKVLNYEIGVVSTGNYAVLIKEKEKTK